MEQALLVLTSLLLIATAVWSGSQLITVLVNEGVSTAPQRATWWLRGALFPVTGVAGWIVSTFMVDPYSWWIFLVGTATVLWLAISAVITHGVWEEFQEESPLKLNLWSIAIFALVAAVIVLPFRGFAASGWLISIVLIYGFMPVVLERLLYAMDHSRDRWGWVVALAIFLILSGWLTCTAVGGIYRSLVKTEAGQMVQRATAPTADKPKTQLPKWVLGKGVWIWLLDRCADRYAGLESMVKQAKWAGVDHILVKTIDARLHLNYPKTGDWMPWGDQGEDVRPHLKELVRLAHAQGIRVYAWGFVWGQEPNREADLVIESLKLGVDGFVYDVEDQFGGRTQAAETMCLKVADYVRQTKSDALIGFSSYDNPYYHPNVPWTVFDQYCAVFAPQTYWKDDAAGQPTDRLNWAAGKWASFQNQVLKPAGGGRSFDRIIPIGHAYDPKLADGGHLASIPYPEVLQFMQDTKGFWGVELWVWDYMGPAQWQAMRDGPGGVEDKLGRYQALPTK